jgi:outer membrane protein OmpA-like peptidoglycan-associated protein
MKKSCLALFLVGSAGLLQAQQGTNWVDLQGAYVTPGGEWQGIEIDDSVGLGLGFGRWLTDRWGLEGSLLTTELESNNQSPKVDGDETHFFASGLFNLRPGLHTFYPYLRAGLGASSVDEPWSDGSDSTTRFQYHGGVGIQGFFKEHIFTSLEARAVQIETKSSRTEYMGLLGVGYRWGGAKPVVAPPPPPPVVEEVKPAEPPPPPPPPPPAPEAKPVVVAPPPPPPKIVLDQAVLHFANSRNEISPEGVEAVQKVAEGLKKYPGEYTLVVSGHTSSTGSKAYNKSLSKRRADAVAKVLVDSGIPAASIQTEGVGPDQPIADNTTAEGQARNRRVEIEVKVKDAAVEVQTIQTQTQDTATTK